MCIPYRNFNQPTCAPLDPVTESQSRADHTGISICRYLRATREQLSHGVLCMASRRLILIISAGRRACHVH
eukprot:g37810.t1